MFTGVFQPVHRVLIVEIALLCFGPRKRTDLGKGLEIHQKLQVSPKTKRRDSGVSAYGPSLFQNSDDEQSVRRLAWKWSTKHKVSFELAVEAHGLLQIELR